MAPITQQHADSSNRVIVRHFDLAAKLLDNYFEQSGLATHSDVVGLAREGFVELFLKGNLPSIVDFASGQILDHDDARSNQIDILLQSAFSPRIQLLGNLHLSFSDYVICALEVKSTLTTASWEKPSELRKVLTASRAIKALKRNVKLTKKVGNASTTLETPYCVFAYKGPTVATLTDKLLSFKNYENVEWNAFAPDLITVLDRRYSLVRNNGWLFKITEPGLQYIEVEEKDTLFVFFAYVTLLVEAWNAMHHHHHTDFKSFVVNRNSCDNAT